jgi:hypothetical protein
MAKSLQRLSSDVSSISSAVKDSRATLSEFLKEQAYGVVSQEISNVDGSGNPLALSTIYLENDMKGRMLRYSKVVLTFPDGSNPLIIPNDIGNQPVTGQEDQFDVRLGGVGAEVFPSIAYPVGSLILGLDYEANSINAAASEGGNTGVTGGLCVQYNSGGALAETSLTSAEGGNESQKPFTFNNATGEVQATKFKATDVVTADGGFNSSGLITSKQRQAINCGFYHSTSSIVYLPFGYGGTSDATSSSGYLEFGGYVVPCDGYVEYVVVRGESPGGNTTVGFIKAQAGQEVPIINPGSGVSEVVNMAVDDTGYRFDNFKNSQLVPTNSFSAGDVIMFTLNTTNPLYDAIATAVLVFDWNNQL